MWTEPRTDPKTTKTNRLSHFGKRKLFGGLAPMRWRDMFVASAIAGRLGREHLIQFLDAWQLHVHIVAVDLDGEDLNREILVVEARAGFERERLLVHRARDFRHVGLIAEQAT